MYLNLKAVSFKQKKEKGDSLRYFFQAFQKKKAEIITKTKPVMPLTSLGDNIMLAESKVVNIASPNKIAANIITSNPNIIYSVFMGNYFPRHDLIIVCKKMFSLLVSTSFVPIAFASESMGGEVLCYIFGPFDWTLIS
jgi:hypothetical protein